MAASQTLEVDPSGPLAGLQSGRALAHPLTRPDVHLPHTGTIVAGCVVLIAIVGIIIWIWLRNRRDGY